MHTAPVASRSRQMAHFVFPCSSWGNVGVAEEEAADAGRGASWVKDDVGAVDDVVVRAVDAIDAAGAGGSGGARSSGVKQNCLWPACLCVFWHARPQ